jgi:hypothetical protein
LTNGYLTEQASTLAQKTGVQLWDCVKLAEVLNKYGNKGIEYWRFIEEQPRVACPEFVFNAGWATR